MTTARSDLVTEGVEGLYHCITRCVRRAFLCGNDPYTGRSFEHRKEWVRRRLETLAGVFALEVCAYAVMSNHLHLVVRTRPDWREGWSAEEIARRWLTIFPKRRDESGRPVVPGDMEIRALAGNSLLITEIFRRLGSVSWFMRCLNEPIARRANREDGCKGRFWEGRFKCQALLDDSAVLACMVYVDLNPVRAQIARTPRESRHTSAFERIEAGERSSKARSRRKGPGGGWLCPIGEEDGPRRGLTSLSLPEYLQLLDWTSRQIRGDRAGTGQGVLKPVLERTRINPERWVDTVTGFGRMFHGAAGRLESMAATARRWGLKWIQGIRAGGIAFTSP